MTGARLCATHANASLQQSSPCQTLPPSQRLADFNPVISVTIIKTNTNTINKNYCYHYYHYYYYYYYYYCYYYCYYGEGTK